MLRRLVVPASLILAAFALAHGLAAQNKPAGEPGQSASLTTEQIVANMVSRNESRAAALSGYTGRRVYQLHYRGFPGSRDAELIVQARYSAPATKEFTIVSQSG